MLVFWSNWCVAITDDPSEVAKLRKDFIPVKKKKKTVFAVWSWWYLLEDNCLLL